jgi:hypothetical protein
MGGWISVESVGHHEDTKCCLIARSNIEDVDMLQIDLCIKTVRNSKGVTSLKTPVIIYFFTLKPLRIFLLQYQ